MQRYLKVPVKVVRRTGVGPESLFGAFLESEEDIEWGGTDGTGSTEEEAFEDLKRKLGYEEAE